MDMKSNILEFERGDVIILRVKGKLDASLSPILEKKALDLIQAGHPKIVLDFGEVGYINSAGLRTLIAIKKQIKGVPGKLIIAALQEEVLEIMKICGFDHVLDITPNEEEALRQLK